MEHAYKNIAIIGAGASGCLCAYFLLKKGYALGFISQYGFIAQVNKLIHQEKVLNKMVKNIDKIKQEKSMEKLFVNSEKLLKK